MPVFDSATPNHVGFSSSGRQMKYSISIKGEGSEHLKSLSRVISELKKWPESDKDRREGLPSHAIHQGGSKFLLAKSGPQTSSIWGLVKNAECQA